MNAETLARLITRHRNSTLTFQEAVPIAASILASPEWKAMQLDPRVSIRTIEHDGGGLEITADDNYYLDEEYVTVDGRHVLRLWVRPEEGTNE